MKAFKIYFDKNDKKFKCTDDLSEVGELLPDGTTQWIADENEAKRLTDVYNHQIDDVVICKSCGESFWQRAADRDYYAERFLPIPAFCHKCKYKSVKNAY